MPIPGFSVKIIWGTPRPRANDGRSRCARDRAFRPILVPLEDRIALSDDAIPRVDLPIERFDAEAIKRHAEILNRISTTHDDVVFFGDSITYGWMFVGVTSWIQKIVPFGAADFGVRHDTSRNLLWRLENGELDGQPKVAVVAIGTNDLLFPARPDHRVEDAVDGITAVVSTIQARSPQTKILLTSVFDQGVLPDDPLRIAARQINGQIAEMARSKGVDFLNVAGIALKPDGTRPHDRYGIHIGPDQYDAWANALYRPLVRLLGRPAGPVVQSVKLIPVQTVDMVVLRFSGPLEPNSAGKPANYRLVLALAGKRPGTGTNLIRQVIYNPKTSTTTLMLDRSLNPTALYELTVNGARPSGLRDRSGVYLDGSRNGRPGNSFRGVIDHRTVY